MSMKSWAQKEIDIACKRERGNAPEDEWDYGVACYESALKAYNSLMGDGHSGYSIGFTKNILNRLLDGKPLTPIEDTTDIWNDITSIADTATVYQCNRMSSLFKYLYSDGLIEYKDIDSYYCIDIHDDKNKYRSGIVSKVVVEMFPITMPYSPGDPIKVYCEDFLVDVKNGDYDTKGIFYAIKPEGEKVHIYRFFKEENNQWVEIDEKEYYDRKEKTY